MIKDKIIELPDLRRIRERNKDKIISLCSGCFDMLHKGHATFLELCKTHSDILVVSVGSDSVIKSLKGMGRPIMPEDERLYMVAAVESVDYTIRGSSIENMRSGKIDFYETIKELKPDIFILNENDSAIEEKQMLCNELGIELRLVPSLAPEISTTRIIGKLNNQKNETI